MRTKILLLSAACAVAGSVGVNAQVYSVNAVGYVNVTCPPGFSIIANPLIAATNQLSVLIANPPDSTQVYEWANGKFQIATYYVPDGWDNDLTLAPGTGAWINNPSSTNIVITFVGEVAQGGQTNDVPVGYSIKGSIVPQSAALDTVLGYTPSDSDQVYFWRHGKFEIDTYYVPDGWDNTPVPNVGEGFWILTSQHSSWTRTFNINNN